VAWSKWTACPKLGRVFLYQTTQAIPSTHLLGSNEVKRSMSQTLATESIEAPESLLIYRSCEGLEMRAKPLHITPNHVVFETYSPGSILQISEVLNNLAIFIGSDPIYSGRATITGLVNAGAITVCEAKLENALVPRILESIRDRGSLSTLFGGFVKNWQSNYQIISEFKVAVSDIQTFLINLREWLEQIELGIRSSPDENRYDLECQIIEELRPSVLPCIDHLFGKFEALVATLDSQSVSVYRHFIQRHLHPIVLCAPFAYRTYQKPLGYAGDYEMVNMMVRDPREGGSLFAKVFNVWLLEQGLARAHRNRIQFLFSTLVSETARLLREGQRIQVYNLGSGPATEVQKFLAESDLSNSACFTLVDFSDEAIAFSRQKLSSLKGAKQRQTTLDYLKKSVGQILKESLRQNVLTKTKAFDFIYCAGLLDYLPDAICRPLISIAYRSLAPGGLFLATNVHPRNPNRASLGLILDWNLAYRDGKELAALVPEEIDPDDVRVFTEDTGLNLILELRKSHAE
jgi:extracellular factor (EF) 3-hydroxypalmitic acid methyl ester biosynthesis protein